MCINIKFKKKVQTNIVRVKKKVKIIPSKIIKNRTDVAVALVYTMICLLFNVCVCKKIHKFTLNKKEGR